MPANPVAEKLLVELHTSLGRDLADRSDDVDLRTVADRCRRLACLAIDELDQAEVAADHVEIGGGA